MDIEEALEHIYMMLGPHPAIDDVAGLAAALYERRNALMRDAGEPQFTHLIDPLVPFADLANALDTSGLGYVLSPLEFSKRYLVVGSSKSVAYLHGRGLISNAVGLRDADPQAFKKLFS